MTMIYNKSEHKEKRIELRNNMTNAEKLLWSRLRKRQIKNKRFLRQYGVKHHVIDFYCPKIKLAIEVNGDTKISEEEIMNDLRRQSEIERFGIRFLRFRNEDIIRDLNEVVLKIETAIENLNCPHFPKEVVFVILSFNKITNQYCLLLIIKLC